MLAVLLLLLVLEPAHSAPVSGLQSLPGRAEVRAIKGTATYSLTNGGPQRPLKVGTVLRSHAVVTTGAESTVDLFMGLSAGVIRVAEKSRLSLDKLTLTDTGADTAVEVQLHLPDGEMYFNVNKLSKASRYEVKMPNGVAGIRGTKGSFSSRVGGVRPPIVLLDGRLVFVHAAPNGTVTSYTLNAPPAVYFTAGGGVQDAPPEMTLSTTEQVKDVSTKATPPAPNPPPPKTQPPPPTLSPGTGSKQQSTPPPPPPE